MLVYTSTYWGVVRHLGVAQWVCHSRVCVGEGWQECCADGAGSCDLSQLEECCSMMLVCWIIEDDSGCAVGIESDAEEVCEGPVAA